MEKSFNSFEIVSEDTIIKRIDKSLLAYGEIRIPNYLRDFFHFHEMEKHDRWDIRITYNKKDYFGVLYLDDYKKLRGKLRWGKELTRQLKDVISKYTDDDEEYDLKSEDTPLLRLEKVEKKAFHLDIIFPEEVRHDANEYMSHNDRFIYGIRSRFETDPDIRLSVLKFHGTSCGICGFNYEDFYGDLGRGYIQVHQIYENDEDMEDYDLQNDFIPICENCHGIIHRSKESHISIEDLKQIIKIRTVLRKAEKE